jgi:hypothetical protein
MDSQAILIPKYKLRWITPEFRIAIRIFFCFTLFLAIIQRWSRSEDLMENVSNPANLNFAYAKNIDIETYLMTRSQLKQLFPPSEDPPKIQWHEKQTGKINDRSPLYFVIRLRNRGNSNAWGRLRAHSKKWIRGSGVEQRDIPVQYLPPQMQSFKTIILAAAWSVSGFEDEEKSPSDIKTEWTSLYTSNQEEQKHGQ